MHPVFCYHTAARAEIQQRKTSISIKKCKFFLESGTKVSILLKNGLSIEKEKWASFRMPLFWYNGYINLRTDIQIEAQRSGFDLEKEEGTYGYAAFLALTVTREAEWSKFLLTWCTGAIHIRTDPVAKPNEVGLRRKRKNKVAGRCGGACAAT